MPSEVEPELTLDEIDDLLYLVRINEEQELSQTIARLAENYNCTAKQLLAAAIDPATGNTVLHYCSANGFADLLEVLLSQLGIQPATSLGLENRNSVHCLVNHKNKQGNTPLHWTAYNGHLEVVKVLVAAGADPWAKNSAGHLALFESENAGKSDVAEYLATAYAANGEQSTLDELRNNEIHAAGEADQADGSSDIAMGGAGPSD